LTKWNSLAASTAAVTVSFLVVVIIMKIDVQHLSVGSSSYQVRELNRKAKEFREETDNKEAIYLWDLYG